MVIDSKDEYNHERSMADYDRKVSSNVSRVTLLDMCFSVSTEFVSCFEDRHIPMSALQ